METNLYQGDCLELSKTMPDKSIDLIYLDPPFFTQRVQRLGARDRQKAYSFSDVWRSLDEYAEYIYLRLREFHRVLAATGSIFFHCDHNASHVARILLDEVFGKKMFRSEIIWHYRRWSNSQRTLLPAHQNIYFYSKTDEYKFREILQEYSPSTNVDQILQKRARDEFGKSAYARNEDGSLIPDGYKKGVPLSDVWDIPFLNPKAKERVGYPTQKPVLLLERIIEISTDESDWVLDPFCGSGTALVASSLLKRNSIGIDISQEAIDISRKRLVNPEKTRSFLLRKGREAYQQADEDALAYLKGLDLVPVQRNSGIDALLKTGFQGGPVPIRIQRTGESLLEAARSLHKAAKTKNASVMILVATGPGVGFDAASSLPPGISIINATASAIHRLLKELEEEQA
jgi:site-specific DNA-methyltransferase (adenine-specific)